MSTFTADKDFRIVPTEHYLSLVERAEASDERLKQELEGMSDGIKQERIEELEIDVKLLEKEIKLQDVQIDKNDQRIERLMAENERLKEALVKIRECALKFDFDGDYDIAFTCQAALEGNDE